MPPRIQGKNPNNFNDLIGDPAFLTYVDNRGFIGYDCLSFNSLYNLIRVSNFTDKQLERYGDRYVKPEYIANPTYYVTTGHDQLKSFKDDENNWFSYCFFKPSSSDSLRLANLPAIKQNPEPYIGKFELDADMSREQLDSLYRETYDAYLTDLDELAFNRMKEFARINYTPAYEILAQYYGYGWGNIPVDYEMAEEYAKIAFETEDTPFGFRPVTRHYLETGDFEHAEPYLEIMANCPYKSPKKEALKNLSDEYLSRNDSVTAFKYLNDYVYLLDFEDENDTGEITRVSELYNNYDNPVAANGLLNLGFKYLAKDIESEAGINYVSRCYDMDPGCENENYSLARMLYITNYSIDNPDDYPIFSKFKDAHAATATIADNPDFQAAAIGWSGEYYILKFGDWNPYSNTSVYTEISKCTGDDNPSTPFEVVLMDKKGKIVSHTFIGKIGAYINIRNTSPKEVRKVRKAYDKWLKKKN